MATTEFGTNVSFVRFLLLAKSDSAVMESLQAGEVGLVDSFPGLSENERRLLRSLNWKATELAVEDADLQAFKAGGDLRPQPSDDLVCESKFYTEVAEQKCYKL